MDLSRCSMKKIRELIVFTAFLVVALWKFDVVIEVLKSIWKIVFPFALGGAIAFVINVPMSFLEKKMLGKIKENNKIGKKAARPISLLLTIILVAGVIILVMFGVIPQLTQTMGNLMTSISDFIPKMQNWIREFSHDNQDIMKLVDQLQFQPDQAIKWGISLLGNGVGNMMNTTMSAVGSIASGLATFFISFSFACYILFQKEKLHLQVRKVIFAFIPKQKADAILNICSLTYRTFANFLAGQCLEAVILGMMFVITLSILKMPYALLIGILIAFTALVPIFGAFIGCAVGSFLIFMVNPKQAVLFIIVFLLLQQIEGNLSSCGWRISRTSINLGTGGSYNRRKSYGNYRYADFHSTCIGILYYIPGVRISAPKKTTYKTSNENGCGRVCGGGNCVILYWAE